MKKIFFISIFMIFSSALFAQNTEVIVLQFGYPPNGLIVKKVMADGSTSEEKYMNDRKTTFDFLLIYKEEIEKIINAGYELFHSSTLHLGIDGSTTEQNFIFVKKIG